MKIGIISDSFRLNLRDGLKKAAQLGADGVQIYAVQGEMAPENLSAQQRRDLKHYIADLGLEVSALCGDMGGHAFTREAENAYKVERSCRIMDLALDLDCHVVTTHIGVVPGDPNHPRYAVMQKACRAMGEYGDKVGCKFAIETGPETSNVLRPFLDSLGCKSMCVNLDPANLTMVSGDDAVQAVYTLAPYIVHTHAKDGRMINYHDPELIYDFFAGEESIKLAMEDCFIELPLGEGDVDWPNYIKALKDIGYDGYLTIEREVGDDPAKDIGMAVDFLRKRI